ncbi:hypothetical protein KEM56_002329 [Ascosphaera pollenicola]|nr:hypothetical protein KEM56_002329 [Ascosphaera pollenicola]
MVPIANCLLKTSHPTPNPNLLNTSSPFRPSRTFGSIRGSPFKRHQSTQSLSASASASLAPPPLKSSASSVNLGHEAGANWTPAPVQPVSGHSPVQAPSKLKQSLNATVVDATGSDEEEEQIVSENIVAPNPASREGKVSVTAQAAPPSPLLAPSSPKKPTTPAAAPSESAATTSQHQLKSDVPTPELKPSRGRPLSAVQSKIAAAEAVGKRELPPTPTGTSFAGSPASLKPESPLSPPAPRSPLLQQQATLSPPSPRPLSHRASAEFQLPPLRPQKSLNVFPSPPPPLSPTKPISPRPLPAMPGSVSPAPLNTAARPPPFQNDAVSRLPTAQVRELRESFQVLDRDNDGTITREDVAEMLISLGLDASRATTDTYYPPSLGSEAINLPSYLNNIANLLEPFSSREELLNAFSAFDEDDSGQVDLEELKTALLDPALSGAGSDGLKLTAKDIEDSVKGFTARKVFDAKSAKGSAHGQWTGGRRPDVLRYQDFVANITGPVGQEQG